MFENFIKDADEKLLDRGKIIVRNLASIMKTYTKADERIQVADYEKNTMNWLNETVTKFADTVNMINDLHNYLQSFPAKMQSEIFSVIDGMQEIEEEKRNFRLYDIRDKIQQDLNNIGPCYEGVKGRMDELQNDLNFMVGEFGKQNFKIDQTKTTIHKLRKFLQKIDELSMSCLNPIIVSYTELKYGLTRISGKVERIMKK
jgi:uncharacterized phage infection (PIP) family protein YhgE